MTVQTFLVRLREPVTEERVLAVRRRVTDLGGTVELVAGNGTLVVNLDDSRIGEVRSMAIVALVGGVTMNRRWVR